MIGTPARSSVAAVGGYLITLALLVAAIGLGVATQGIRVRPDQQPLLEQLGSFGPMLLLFATVGVVLSIRRPRNAIGWLFMLVGFCAAVQQAATGYGVLNRGTVDWAVAYVAWTGELFGKLTVFVGVMALAMFPTGTLRSRAAGFAAALLLMDAALTTVAAFAPRFLEIPRVASPFGIAALAPLNDVAAPAEGLLLAGAALASAATVVARYRRGAPTERQQLKWLLCALSIVLAGIVGGILGVVFVPWLTLPAFVTMLLGFASIPVAVAVAVLRYRLYDLDVVINRTLVYGALTIAAATVFFGGLVLLQSVLQAVNGGSDLGVAVSTLITFALVRPLRTRIQSAVDRRFYRVKYDAAKTIAQFSARLRQQVDLHLLEAELVSVVRDTVHPAHASLWLRENRR